MRIPRPRGTHTPRVAGRRVLITGGARGIGAATAGLFRRHGAQVWIGDVDIEPCQARAAEVGATAVHLDVTDPESWRRVVEEMREHDGEPDILVNNAGVMPLGGFIEQEPAVRDLVLDVNVTGVLNGMRAVIPGMIERGGGHIVNVASMAGLIPIPGMVTYNASKFAALGASLAARREYAGTGVTVSAVLPSAVRTELSSGAPLGGGMPTVDPEDVAQAVLDTDRTRAARTSVPRWVAPLWDLTAFVPEPVENLVRGVIDDRRVLTSLDMRRRRGYDERLARHADEHEADRGVLR